MRNMTESRTLKLGQLPVELLPKRNKNAAAIPQRKVA